MGLFYSTILKGLMHYIISIDETGNFSPIQRVSVGGYVVANTSDSSSLDKEISCFSQKADNTFNCPGDLHFSELFAGKKKTTVEYPGRTVTHKYLHSLLSQFTPRIKYVFTTINTSRIHVHEQHNYFIHLETAILSLAESLDLKPADKVDIYISSRRGNFETGPAIMGIWGYENKEEYENRMAQHISACFSIHSGLNPNNVRAKFLVNAKYAFLCMADILVSSSVRNDTSELTKIFADKLLCFDVRQHQWISAPDLAEQYNHTPQEEKTEALFDLLCRVAKISESSARHVSGKEFFIREFAKLEDRQRSSFALTMRERFACVMTSRGTFPCALTDASRRLTIIKPCLNLQDGKPSQGLDQIMKEFLWEKVQLMSHGFWPHSLTGTDDIDRTINELRQFCDTHYPLLYDTPLDFLRDKAEHALIFVQSGAFDRFRFEDIERFLKKDIEPYRETINFITNLLAISDSQDHFLGKAAGTIGQAHGFLMCTHGLGKEEKEFHFEIAQEQLLEDLKHFEKGTKDWLQGNNYLVTLYWQNRQIEKACFNHLWNYSSKTELDLKTLLFRFDNKIKEYSQGATENWDGFILCNHLRLGALAIESCSDKIAYKNSIIGTLSKMDIGYPGNIAAKWGAYILDRLGARDESVKLLQKAGITGANHTTLKLMDILNKTFIFKLSNKISDRESEELRNQLIFIMEQGDGYKIYLKNKEWINFVLKKDVLSCNIDDIVMGLPYYYT